VRFFDSPADVPEGGWLEFVKEPAHAHLGMKDDYWVSTTCDDGGCDNRTVAVVNTMENSWIAMCERHALAALEYDDLRFVPAVYHLTLAEEQP
jgi:hypothetical protein